MIDGSYRIIYRINKKSFDVLNGELSFETKVFDGFNDDEIIKLVNAANFLNMFVDNMHRCEAVIYAYESFLTEIQALRGLNRKEIYLVRRLVRSYILEFDILLKHWERYVSRKSLLKEFRNITHKIYDKSDAYALVCMMRNYLLHNDDVIHGHHLDVRGSMIWTDRDILMSDGTLTKNKKDIIKRQCQRIDLIDVVKKSFCSLMEIHEETLKLLINNNIRDSYLLMMSAKNKIMLIDATAWWIVRFTGHESGINPETKKWAGGFGVDCILLDWNEYRKIGRLIENIKNRN